jgi:very-short-patch-repair endonuclease
VPGRCHDRRFVCENCVAGVNGRPLTRGRARELSPLELRVLRTLLGTGYRVEQERRVGKFWLDFVVPALRLAVEAQSLTYHRHPSRRARDRRKRVVLEKAGWYVAYVSFPDPEGQTQAVVTRREAELGS